MKKHESSKGFTLIELLVVVAIIALLIGILLPALSRAKKAAWMAISMSNIKQINTGAASYRSDNDGYMPLTLTYQRGTDHTDEWPNYVGWCTWSYGGKNCNSYWAGNGMRRKFDVEAADRPLNPYVHGDTIFDAPPFDERMEANDLARERDQAPVFKDPSDKATRQRNWPQADESISSYDDVGTSYHFNVKWFHQIATGGGWSERDFDLGTQRMRVADAYSPSRFVWVHDQTPDVVVNTVDAWIENGYGDINKGIMGHLDGHGSYLKLNAPEFEDDPSAYQGDGYTFIFDSLRDPGDP
jgi:prepilin-type N-terminal cleavage/methylation domain-containing protein